MSHHPDEKMTLAARSWHDSLGAYPPGKVEITLVTGRVLVGEYESDLTDTDFELIGFRLADGATAMILASCLVSVVSWWDDETGERLVDPPGQ